MRIAAGKFQHGTGRGPVVVLRQACAAAAGTLQHVGIGCRPRIDGARVDGHAPSKKALSLALRLAPVSDRVPALVVMRKLFSSLTARPYAPACAWPLAASRRRPGCQPAQGLASCVIDVHRSLIIVVIVGGEIRGAIQDCLPEFIS
jgi:hypothetical protein